MRAMLVNELGKPDTLTLTETASPPPGPGEVRVAVHAAGCNFADTLMISGHYQYKPEFAVRAWAGSCRHDHRFG